MPEVLDAPKPPPSPAKYRHPKGYLPKGMTPFNPETARVTAQLAAEVRKAKSLKLAELTKLVETLSARLAEGSAETVSLALRLNTTDADDIQRLRCQIGVLNVRIENELSLGNARVLRDLCAALECLRRQERMLRSPIREAPGHRAPGRKRSTPTPV